MHNVCLEVQYKVLFHFGLPKLMLMSVKVVTLATVLSVRIVCSLV